MKISWVIITVVLGLIFLFLIRSNLDIILTNKDLPGIYVYNRNLNTSDTLWIFSNGKYLEKVYDKNRKLIVVRNAFWESEKDLKNNLELIVHFKNMVLNDDRKISYSRNYSNTKMDLITSVIQDNGTIKIDMDSDQGFYFIKQKK